MSKSVWKFLYFVFPAVLYAGVIFYLSSLEHVSIPEFGLDTEDKLLHALEYFGLAVLTARAFQGGSKHGLSRGKIALVVLLAALYAASDEIHQYFVPGRSSDFFDWLADVVGIFIGVGFYARLHSLETHLLNYTLGTLKRHETPAK